VTDIAAYSVCCARCGHWWHENDPEVRYADGDWQCTSQAYCDARERENQP
jgi:hypothetical protein